MELEAIFVVPTHGSTCPKCGASIEGETKTCAACGSVSYIQLDVCYI